MSWKERAKRILKRVGGVAIAAATMSLGGGIAAPAIAGIGGFLARRLGHWLGIGPSEVPNDPIEGILSKLMGKSSDSIKGLFKKDEMDVLAGKIAEKIGMPQQEVYVAVHASVRDLQSTLSQLTEQMAENHELIRAILEESRVLDKKMDKLLEESMRTGTSIQEMLRTLQGVDRKLDNVFQAFAHDYMREPLTPPRLLNLSRLQRQDVTLASKFDIAFNPDLYVNRQSSEHAFQVFMEEAAPDQTLFLVLGNTGLGKTWLMAHLSAKALENRKPAFFVPLKQGVTPLTSLFRNRSFVELVNSLDKNLQESNQRVFLFLDGLDEMDSQDRIDLLADLAAVRRYKRVSIVLSCRLIDWNMDHSITDRYDAINRGIYPNREATQVASTLGVHTSVSIILKEFTENELAKAAEEYELPTPLPSSLVPLLHMPYILRLIASYYHQTDQFPDPTQPEMLDLFADVDKPYKTILGRLGILFDRRDLLMNVSEKILSTTEASIPRGELKIQNDENFYLLLSSGILQITLKDYGMSVHLNPFYDSLLAALILQKYQHDQRKFTAFYHGLQHRHSQIAHTAANLLQLSQPPTTVTGVPGPVPPHTEDDFILHDNGVLSLAVSMDGNYIVSSSLEQVGVWKFDTRESHYSFKAAEKSSKGIGIVVISLSPDGQFIISGSDDSKIRIWNFNNGSLVDTLEGHEKGIYSVAVSPDSRFLVTGSWDKKVGIWELATGRLIGFLKGHKGGISTVAVSPNNNYLVSGSEDKSLRVWEMRTGKSIYTLKGHKGPINSVTFSPNGRHIISCGEDKTIRVWAMRSGKLLRTLKGHKKWVRSVAMSPDGRYVVSGSQDKTVRVWDMGSGELLHTFKGHDKAVYSVVVSRNGQYILSGSMDKKIRFWRLDNLT